MSFGSADRQTHAYDQAPSRRVGPVVAMPFFSLLYVSMPFSPTSAGSIKPRNWLRHAHGFGGEGQGFEHESGFPQRERAVDLSLAFRRTRMLT